MSGWHSTSGASGRKFRQVFDTRLAIGEAAVPQEATQPSRDALLTQRNSQLKMVTSLRGAIQQQQAVLEHLKGNLELSLKSKDDVILGQARGIAQLKNDLEQTDLGMNGILGEIVVLQARRYKIDK